MRPSLFPSLPLHLLVGLGGQRRFGGPVIGNNGVALAFSPGAPPAAALGNRHQAAVVVTAPLSMSTAEAPPTLTTAKDADADAELEMEIDGELLRVCIEKLGKRLELGPGSLDLAEVREVEAAADGLLTKATVPAAAAVPAPAATIAATAAAAVPAAAAVRPVPLAPPSPSDLDRLKTAALKMDIPTLTSLLDAGARMDVETTEAAFWAVVNAVDRAEALDEPLSGDVPRMLHAVFDADLDHLLTREHVRTNVTCMMPDNRADFQGRMNYVFDDGCHKDLPLMEGRRCEDGNCCDECSRNLFPTFATENEIDFSTFPDIASLSFNELEKVPASTIIQFVRLIERVRRTIAHEYGLDLSTVLPLQAYSRKYVAGTTQKGGGGGEGDFVILHTDEATHSGYHYSCVLYLSTQGEDFEGGDFVWNDPADVVEGEEVPKPAAFDEEDSPYASLEDEIRRAGRKLTPFHPTRGAAVIFSSGWENMHEVEKITSGTRYAVPCFFTTCPVPDIAYDQMVQGKPKTDEDIADDWLHLLLAHRQESPVESVGRVKELLMKWHVMCTPLSRH